MEKKSITVDKYKKQEILNQTYHKLKKNQLLIRILQYIVRLIRLEFVNHTHAFNGIVRKAYQIICSEEESQERKEVLSIWSEIQIFAWNLTVCPKYWVMMFQNEEFFSTEGDAIDMHIFTSKIYKFILKKASEQTIYTELLHSMVTKDIFIYYEEVSVQICQCYQRGAEIIKKETSSLEQKLKSSKIINFYFIYKVLKEISQYCEESIKEDLSSSIFINIEEKYTQDFTYYIIQKHQILSLKFNENSSNKEEDDSLVNIIERIKKAENLKWREAVRQDGKSAIIVEFQNQNQKKKQTLPENFMIKMDDQGKIKVTKCNNINKKWTVTEAANKNTDILNLVSDKNQMGKRLRNSPTETKHFTNTYYFSTVGGALGKCLAEIDKYDSVGDFVFDLSKRSIMSGTFHLVATRIPLVGILFVTGGFSYTLFGIFSNDAINNKKKFQQVGYVTFDVASSVGTGILGAVVGQALIPVPFLGAFVGALVGSFVGEIGGRAVVKILESARFKKIIVELEESIQPAGYWEVNAKTLGILNLNKKTFYDSIPENIQHKLGCDKFWFAMIGFTILTFSQSKKRAEFMKEKVKELEKMKKEDKDLSFKQVKKELDFQTSENVTKIMKYFQKNEVTILSCFDELDKFVMNIFSMID